MKGLASMRGSTALKKGDVVTLIVRHRIKPGQTPAYEDWLHSTTKIAAGYPGHLGVDVVREESQFTSVLRFAGIDELQAWLDSCERKRLIQQVAPLLAEGDNTEIDTSHEFWFTPSERVISPRWKQAVVTFLVILPLSILVPLGWQPLFAAVPWFGGFLQSNFLVTLTIVLLVVYLFMPPVTRWCADWLNRP